MAENEDRGRGDSARLNQKGRKRREPPIIDGSATDVSDTPSTAAPDVTHPDPDPVLPASLAESAPEAPAAEGAMGMEMSQNAEPVLFGQPPRPAAPEAADFVAPAAVAPEPPAAEAREGAALPLSAAEEFPPLPASPEGPESEVTDRAPEADSQSPATALPATRSSVWSPLSVLLGIVVLALLGAIAALLYTEPQRTGSAEASASLQALSGRVAALEARPDPATAVDQANALDQRTQALDGEVASLKTALANLAKTVEDVGAKTEANGAKLAAAPDNAPSRPAAMAQGPAPVSSTAAGPAPALAADLSALSSKVDDLNARFAALASPAPPAAAPPVDLGPLEARLAEVDHRLNALTTTVGGLPKTDLGPLQGSITALGARLAAVESVLSTPKAGDRVTEARAEGDAAEARAAPLAVVSQALIQGIEAGRPLAPEVDALRGLGIDDASLRPLTGAAVKGAATDDMLKAQWAGLEGGVLSASRPDEGASVLDRLAAGAKSLVQIRKVGAGAGSDPSSVVSRIDAALDRGDVAAALSEWSRLPDAGRAASQAWADAARTRLDAETAARGLLSRAIATLAKSKG